MSNADDPAVENMALDMRGRIYLSCQLLSLKQVNDVASELKQGSREIHILTDNRQVTSTIPEAVTKMGYQVDITRQIDGYHIRICYPQKEQASL